MLVCIYVCSHHACLVCVLSWPNSTDGFPRIKENFLSRTQNKYIVLLGGNHLRSRPQPVTVGRKLRVSATGDLNP